MYYKCIKEGTYINRIGVFNKFNKEEYYKFLFIDPAVWSLVLMGVEDTNNIIHISYGQLSTHFKFYTELEIREMKIKELLR